MDGPSPEAEAGGHTGAEQVSTRQRGPIAPTSDVLTHSPLQECNATSSSAKAQTSLRVVTWNIEAARSAPLDEVAAELRQMNADVMALQEVDLRVRRTGYVDQPAVLAAALGVQYAFAASIKYDGGDYGLGVLSRWPLTAVRRHRLDSTDAGEHRIVLEVVVCVSGQRLRLFNHHADLRLAARQRGFEQLRDLVVPHLEEAVVVAGDFNDDITGPRLKGLMESGLVDVAAGAEATAAGGRVDYLLASASMARRRLHGQLWRTRRSDHHAVIAEFAWTER